MDTEAIALLHHLGYAEVLVLVGFVTRLRNKNLALHPAHFLGISVLHHVLRIVGVVVDAVHGAQLVISLGEHAFQVHIGESHGADYLLHPMLAAPFLHGTEQQPRHFGVVDEVNPAKAHGFLSPLLVGFAVDDGAHSAHYLAAAPSQEPLSLAEAEGRVLLLVECVQCILQEIGHRIGVVLVEFVIEAHKLLELVVRLDTADDSVFCCHVA